MALAQLRGCRLEHELECRPDARGKEMPAGRAAVGRADDDVRVDLRLAVRDGDIPEQAEHLDLLVERDPRVVLARPVEVTEHDALEGANSRDRRGGDTVLPRE